MQAAGLKFFIEEIRKEDSAFSSDVLAWTVYVKMREHWAQEGQQPLEEKNLSQTFDHLLSTGKYSCPPRSRRAYFPIQPLSLILGADFQSRPRSRTQQRISNALRRALKHAQDAFNANHDVLTGAPNRVAFEKKLAEAIDTSFAGIDGSSDTLTAAEVISPSTLALVALDIDHFKQLNDTFGHLYGDVVLQVFVRRLERHLARLEQQFADRLHTSFARLGGEEFGILVLGRLTSNDLKQVAEEIRSSIAEVPLPTDEEWTALEQATPVSSLSLPHIADRRVTISVGVAVLPPAVTTEGSSALSSHLRSNADAALFRAKAGGRNTVRHYSEILDRHGRTLQHHSATGLVAIDIGRAVGVVVGQEFTVFHPDFVGDKPFLYDDGLTSPRKTTASGN
jgi:diguanylate cyclase (GGDEF)-like protein